MNQIFPKKKEKRPRPSNAANNSFVKNVTSRVTGLLPATITKWFSSPSSSNTNGSAPTGDASDSSEDEAPSTPVITQPPAKRMRFSSPGTDHYGLPNNNWSASGIEIIDLTDSPVFGGAQYAPPNQNTFTTPLQPPNEELGPMHRDTSHLFKCPPHTVSSVGQSVANKRKSIFDTVTYEESVRETDVNAVNTVYDSQPLLTVEEENITTDLILVDTVNDSQPLSTVETEYIIIEDECDQSLAPLAPEGTSENSAKAALNTMPDPKSPSFKPSLLGSPFYPGRTMYGGAASSSYINQPNIKRQSVAVVNESQSNDDTAISSSARRIMELLESYSSPVMEARRVPLYTKPKNHGFNNSYSPYTNKCFSYKTQELYVPSIASILQMKKKSRLMDTTKAARQIIASHSSAGSTSTFPTFPSEAKGKEPEKEQPYKMTTKVKARVTRTNRGIPDQYEDATPVKLPTAVLRLDEDKLPRFTFSTPSVSKQPATSTPKIVAPAADKNISAVSASKHETVTNSVFLFSNPVKVSSNTPQACTTPPIFTFDSPERRIDEKFESKCDDCSVVVGIVKEPEKSITKSKDWGCPECWVRNKADVNKCVCCGSKQPTPNPKCSICKLADSQSQKDKCANCEKMSVTPVVSPLTTKPSSKWKCEDCWISNEDSASKCNCCGATRPRKLFIMPATATVTSITDTVVPQTSKIIFKPVPVKAVPATANVDTDWRCDDCWISNKSSVDKCAACGGARPSAKQTSAADVPNTNSFFGTSDDKFKNIIKSQKSETWECSNCLVRNDSDQVKCVCCGAAKENKKILPDTKFNFEKTANSSFKFGIDPKVQEATITKKPEIVSKLDSKLKTQSETNNNILSDTPTFTFTLPNNKIENKTNTSLGKSNEAPKINFTFGIPNPITTSAVGVSKLSETNKDLEEEKLQEVPSVDLNAPVQSTPLIMSALKQMNDERKTLTSGTLLNPLATDAKTDTPLNSINLPGSSDAEKPKPMFSFGVTANTKLFEPPARTSTPMNVISEQPQPATLPTTSAPTLSLFKLPEASTSTTSLFQQPNLTDKPMPAPLFQNSEAINNATAPPMFSFGNNAPINPAPPAALTLLPAPEKPQFQFTFGSNPASKTDSGGLFKSPFGAPESSNVHTNAFNLPTGSLLASNNNLPTNTLGGSNGLSGSNGLIGNTMAGNSLGLMAGNSLSSNTLSMENDVTLEGTNGLSATPMGGPAVLHSASTLAGAALNIFNNTIRKENMWSASSNAQAPSLFVSNNASSSLQKPPTFTFGSSTPFNAASNPPTFGTTAAPPQNIFGMNNQNKNTPSPMFSNTVQTQPTGNLFGSPQPASNPTQPMPMFGTPSIGATPTFGSPNQSIPSFDAPTLTPAPAPAFNFGAPQSTGIFGFGQQQQLQQQQQMQQQQQIQQQQQMQQQHMQQQQMQQQLQHQASPQQTGVYSFGGAPAGAPQVQFSMGSGANPAVRRVRKAVRRNPQR